MSSTNWTLIAIFALNGISQITPSLHGWILVIANFVLAGLAAVLHQDHVERAAATGSIL